MRKILKIVSVAVVAALLLGAATIAVSAQTPGRGLVGWGKGGVFGGIRPGPGGVGSSGLEAIAKALNMTVEELKSDLKLGKTLADLAKEKNVTLKSLKDAADAAQKEAIRERIEQAVKDGKLTREQADWMLKGMDSGYAFGRGFGMMPGKGTPEAGLAEAAKALGMTTEELSLQLWGGRTLADLAKEKGVDLQKVKDAIEAARKAAMRESIENAVKNGILTREQADWMLQGLEKCYTPGFGMGRVPFMGRGGMRGAPVAPNKGTEKGSGTGTNLPGRLAPATRSA